MKNYITISLLCAGIGFYSCKKDKNTEPDELPENPTGTTMASNYSALKVGNYWIYERFEVDQSGNSTSLNIIDSCYIEKDTTVNGQRYFKYVQPQIVSNNPTIPSVSNISGYVADSLTYIVSYPGSILTPYSYLDTNFIISSFVQLSGADTLYTTFTKMTDKGTMFTTPAGTFKIVNEKTTYTFANNFLSCNQKNRFMNRRRGENIGIVFQDFPFFSALCQHWDRRLIRYHVVL
jgi:hypothetical protein